MTDGDPSSGLPGEPSSGLELDPSVAADAKSFQSMSNIRLNFHTALFNANTTSAGTEEDEEDEEDAQEGSATIKSILSLFHSLESALLMHRTRHQTATFHSLTNIMKDFHGIPFDHKTMQLLQQRAPQGFYEVKADSVSATDVGGMRRGEVFKDYVVNNQVSNQAKDTKAAEEEEEEEVVEDTKEGAKEGALADGKLSKPTKGALALQSIISLSQVTNTQLSQISQGSTVEERVTARALASRAEADSYNTTMITSGVKTSKGDYVSRTSLLNIADALYAELQTRPQSMKPQVKPTNSSLFQSAVRTGRPTILLKDASEKIKHAVIKGNTGNKSTAKEARKRLKLLATVVPEWITVKDDHMVQVSWSIDFPNVVRKRILGVNLPDGSGVVGKKEPASKENEKKSKTVSGGVEVKGSGDSSQRSATETGTTTSAHTTSAQHGGTRMPAQLNVTLSKTAPQRVSPFPSATSATGSTGAASGLPPRPASVHEHKRPRVSPTSLESIHHASGNVSAGGGATSDNTPAAHDSKKLRVNENLSHGDSNGYSFRSYDASPDEASTRPVEDIGDANSSRGLKRMFLEMVSGKRL
jgi:hypothetical protein